MDNEQTSEAIGVGSGSEDHGRVEWLQALVLPITISLSRGIANIRQSWKPLLMGQVLSFLLAASGAANATLHFDCNLSAPATQAGLIYFFLAFHLLFLPRWHRGGDSGEGHDMDGSPPVHQQQQQPLQIAEEFQQSQNYNSNGSDKGKRSFLKCLQVEGSLKVYFIMAFLDVEANFLTFLAFRYTSLTSISLLDSLAIPSAMLFSRLLLKRRYYFLHFIGASICIVGIVTNILGDYHRQDESIGSDDGVDDDGTYENDDDDGGDGVISTYYPHIFRGDVLAITGAMMYGLNDVLTERMVKQMGGVKEYLAIVGFFGCIICVVQASVFEQDSIRALFNNGQENNEDGSGDDTCHAFKSLMILFISASFGVASYMGMSNFLLHSEAALLNLSLLTSDLWAAVFTVVVEKIIPSPNFWSALFLIILGVSVYELSPSPIEDTNMNSSENIDNEMYLEQAVLVVGQSRGIPTNENSRDHQGNSSSRII